MQKFTRAITREIEIAGERLAVTMDAGGISVRPVGSRRPPHAGSWAFVIHLLAGADGSADPAPDDLAAAVARLRGGKAAARSQHKEDTPAMRPAVPAVPSASVPSLLERLERWLTAQRPRYLRNLRPGATTSELDQFATGLGRPLPADLRALLAWHNGQGDDFAGALAGAWQLMSHAQILAAKHDLGTAAKNDPNTGWRSEWIPFLDDDAGNFVVVDPNAVREYWAGKAEHPVVAPSLAAWLEKFVSALERGEYVEDPERGRMLRM